MNHPAVSLIVATVERTKELGPMFESFAAQTFKAFEVIVVDQNLDDSLETYLERARDLGLALKHIRHRPSNLSAARNVGIDSAVGEWVAFPDDDCWYEPDLLAQLRNRFACTDPLSGAAVQWVEEGLPSDMAPKLKRKRSKLFNYIPK